VLNLENSLCSNIQDLNATFQQENLDIFLKGVLEESLAFSHGSRCYFFFGFSGQAEKSPSSRQENY